MRTGNLLETVGRTAGNAFEAAQAARFGERYHAYRRDFAAASRLEFVPAFPLYIMLEQSFRCILRCPSCIHGHPEAVRACTPGVPLMPFELFARIVEEGAAHGLASLSLHANDEPLLVPDLAKRVRLAARSGIMDIIMTTNGLLLTEERARELLEAGLTHILFSLDACTPETYAKVRGGNFAKVLESIDIVRRLRGGSPYPLLRASFVRSRLNEHEQERFVEFFRERVDYLEVQTFSAFKGLNENLIPTGVRPASAFHCAMPFTRLMVRPDGEVLPCCSFYAYDIPVGNLRADSLAAIWHGQAMERLRDQARQGRYTNPTCQECLAATLVPDSAGEANP
jgi:radical SAM protein with 4Fe4S-binding SPASM domain